NSPLYYRSPMTRYRIPTPYKFSALVLSLSAVVLFGQTVTRRARHSSANTHTEGKVGPASIYPDSSRTPGAPNPNITQDNIVAQLCSKTSHIEINRPRSSVTQALKKRQMAQWGLPGVRTNYEEDQLIGLEDGVCGVCESNLW